MSVANLYSVLGVESTASAAEIRVAYKRQALRSHPDKGGSADEFRSVVYAFDVLSSPVSRQKYDLSLTRRALRVKRKKEARRVCPTIQRLHKKDGNGASVEEQPLKKMHATAASPKEPSKLHVPDIGSEPLAPQTELQGSGGERREKAACDEHHGNTCEVKTTLSRKRRKSLYDIVQRRLLRLHTVLSACPAEARRNAILEMSEVLRKAMVAFIEKVKEGGTSSRVPVVSENLESAVARLESNDADQSADSSEHDSRESIDDWRPSETQVSFLSHAESNRDDEFADEQISDSEDSAEAPLLALEFRDGLDSAEQPGQTSSTTRGARRKLRGINEVRARGGYLYYDARVSFRNLTLATRLTRTLEDAVSFHMSLATVRQRVQELEAASQCFESSLEQAIAEAEDLKNAAVSYQVIMDLRHRIGRMVASPRMTSLRETLLAWRRAEDARVEGWSAQRSVWLQWMQVERRARWGICTRTAEEAETFAAEVEEAYAPSRQKREDRIRARLEVVKARDARRRDRAAQRSARTQERQHRLLRLVLPRALNSAERCVREWENRRKRYAAKLAARRLHAERARQKQLRARQRAAIDRANQARKRRMWQWLRRSDLTMDQIKHGFPG